MIKKAFLLLIISLNACSSAETRLEKKRMKNNNSTEKIYRHASEFAYQEELSVLVKRKPYPWENDAAFPRITMDFLRCKGSLDNPVLKGHEGAYEDCNGMHEHGLPYVDGDEFVYPVLITLLNKLQKAFESKVVVTSGHRCPKHHMYITCGESKISKYMIGARVDFTILGMEQYPELIIEKIKELHQTDEEKYQVFKSDGPLAWTNEEIRISVNKEGEHSTLQRKKHPVVTIDVRYDRQKKEAISLDWNKAYKGYIRN